MRSLIIEGQVILDALQESSPTDFDLLWRVLQSSEVEGYISQVDLDRLFVETAQSRGVDVASSLTHHLSHVLTVYVGNEAPSVDILISKRSDLFLDSSEKLPMLSVSAYLERLTLDMVYRNQLASSKNHKLLSQWLRKLSDSGLDPFLAIPFALTFLLHGLGLFDKMLGLDEYKQRDRKFAQVPLLPSIDEDIPKPRFWYPDPISFPEQENFRDKLRTDIIVESLEDSSSPIPNPLRSTSSKTISHVYPRDFGSRGDWRLVPNRYIPAVLFQESIDLAKSDIPRYSGNLAHVFRDSHRAHPHQTFIPEITELANRFGHHQSDLKQPENGLPASVNASNLNFPSQSEISQENEPVEPTIIEPQSSVTYRIVIISLPPPQSSETRISSFPLDFNQPISTSTSGFSEPHVDENEEVVRLAGSLVEVQSGLVGELFKELAIAQEHIEPILLDLTLSHECARGFSQSELRGIAFDFEHFSNDPWVHLNFSSTGQSIEQYHNLSENKISDSLSLESGGDGPIRNGSLSRLMLLEALRLAPFSYQDDSPDVNFWVFDFSLDSGTAQAQDDPYRDSFCPNGLSTVATPDFATAIPLSKSLDNFPLMERFDAPDISMSLGSSGELHDNGNDTRNNIIDLIFFPDYSNSLDGLRCLSDC